MWHVASSTNNRFTDPVVDHRFTRSVVIDSRCGTSRMLGTVHGSRSSRTLPTLCRSDRMWWTVHGSRSSRTLPTLCRSDRMWWTVHVCRPDRMFLTVCRSAWMWRALRLSSLTIVHVLRFFCPTRVFFTHLETSPLPAAFYLIPGTHEQ